MASEGPGVAKNPSEAHRRPSWLKDTTMWLALGLSVATTMVVVAHATSGTAPLRSSPPITQAPTTPSGISRTATKARGTIPTNPRSAISGSTAQTPTTTAASATTATSLVPSHLRPRTPVNTINDVSEQWAGVMAYPDDVSTSYSFITTGGNVIVRTVLARGATPMSASLACTGSQAAVGDVAEIAIHASPGSCTYDLQFLPQSFHASATASYEITAQYLGATPSS